MDFIRFFKSCNSLRLSKSLHAFLIVSNLTCDVVFSTKLIHLYSNFNDLSSSILAFRQAANKNIFSYNSITSACVSHSLPSRAFLFFRELMAASTLRPDPFTFPVALKSCASSDSVKGLHSLLVRMGFEKDFYVCASLVHVYCKFGLVADAQNVFEETSVRDLACWNSLVSGLSQNGKVLEAVQLFSEMVREGVRVNKVTILSILPACMLLDDIFMGALVHGYVVKFGLDTDDFVLNALIDTYGKLGSFEDAGYVFKGMRKKDMISWNTVISVYEQSGHPSYALNLFERMKGCDFKPDAVTVASLASAVAQLGDDRKGRSVHCYIMRRGWDSYSLISGNAIVGMYSKLGKVKDACKVFDQMPAKDVISWNSLITGYSQNGFANDAIEVYEAMEKCGVEPTQGTLVSVLPACSHLGALQSGMRIHGRSIKTGLISDAFVSTCLIDMYAKCGRLHKAVLLFEEVPKGTSFPWNATISGLGVHGLGENALRLFEKMQQEGVRPDHVTFVSLLCACSHSGLVDHGHRCFQLMKGRYGIEPSLKHYSCMVDLLGRAGRLNDACLFIKKMPLKPDPAVWGALLGACRIHGNVELGKLASNHLFEIDAENVGYYVLLSNMHAKVGNWTEVGKVRSSARHRRLMKVPGWSSIEVEYKMNVFFMGDQSHPKYEEIYKEIVTLSQKMKSEGYVPDYSFVLQDVEDDEKEHILIMHSERLAVAFGIISTSPRTALCIFKNLRICGDCHNAMKFISRISERDIIVRDSNRFHHFKSGNCSCADYW